MKEKQWPLPTLAPIVRAKPPPAAALPTLVTAAVKTLAEPMETKAKAQDIDNDLFSLQGVPSAVAVYCQ